MRFRSFLAAVRLLLAAGVTVAVGCRTARPIHDPEYLQLHDAVVQTQQHPMITAAAAVDPIVEELAGPHPVEDYIRFGLQQNPAIQAARKRVEARANQVPQAASLQDPMFGVTAAPEQVQTAAGQQELSLTASQKIPWFGKLSTRAEVAEAEAQVARARLAVVELAVIEKIKRAYYELYFAEQAIRITKVNRKLLLDIERIADSRFKTQQTDQQDVLRAQLEVSDIDAELIRLGQRLESAQARLAGVLHVSPDTRLRARQQLADETVPQDLQRLYQVAIATRPELHAQLAAVMRDRSAVDLAQLNYFPDVTAGVTWIDTASAGLSPVANGRDAVLVGLSVNLPIYQKRLDAGVREAEADAVASARDYDTLRDETLQDVKDFFERARSEQELVKLFRDDIVPKARQTLQASTSAYQVGDVDFLQLFDNWEKLLQVELTYERIRSRLRQTLASLERLIGGYGPALPAGELLPMPENGAELPRPPDEIER